MGSSERYGIINAVTERKRAEHDAAEKVMRRGREMFVPRRQREGERSRRLLVVICCCRASLRCVLLTDL